MYSLLVVSALCSLAANAQDIPAGAESTYVLPGAVTTAFSSYWVKPNPTSEPEPVLFDPVLNITFPKNLTDPHTIPSNVTNDPLYYPAVIANLSSAGKQAVIASVLAQLDTIITSSEFPTNCSKCVAGLSVAKQAALLAPEMVPETMVYLCQKYALHSDSTCEEDFEANTFGAIWTQVLAFADVAGLDGQYICNSIGGSTYCPAPKTSPLNVTGLFPKPKPANPKQWKASNNTIKVWHGSDIHLDPRYGVGSEANCTSNLCCRFNNPNTDLPTGQISVAAPDYGAYACDAPYDLVLGSFQSISPLTGTSGNDPFGFAIYTGDLVSHDPQSELSRAYVEYEELALYRLMKEYLHSTPVYAALGNHDTNPEANNAPHSLPGNLSSQMSWNYDHVAGLWERYQWLNNTIANETRVHYGGFSVRTSYGLRIISFNTDFWYKSNFLNFINTTNPDVSGTFAWMIQELQAAEDAGEPVWIIGHVLSGWDGTNPIPNPTNLFYQIVDRYAPHVIRNVFFGHTHEDFLFNWYANNGTNISAETALVTAWVGPSVTPLTNLNSGYRMYDIDTGSWDVTEAYTFYAAVNSFPNLTSTGPTWQIEYSTRETYGPSIDWPETSPLNATFWHLVSEQIAKNTTLASRFNTLQGKSSIESPNCTNIECAQAKACYMRSASVALAVQNCVSGYGSVQSAFDPA